MLLLVSELSQFMDIPDMVQQYFLLLRDVINQNPERLFEIEFQQIQNILQLLQSSLNQPKDIIFFHILEVFCGITDEYSSNSHQNFTEFISSSVILLLEKIMFTTTSKNIQNKVADVMFPLWCSKRPELEGVLNIFSMKQAKKIPQNVLLSLLKKMFQGITNQNPVQRKKFQVKVRQFVEEVQSKQIA